MTDQTRRRQRWVDGPTLAWFLICVCLFALGVYAVASWGSAPWVPVPAAIGAIISGVATWGWPRFPGSG